MKRRSTSERRAAPLIPTGSLNRHTYRHVVELTEQVFTLIDAGEYDRLETLMHAVPTETPPHDPLTSAWRTIRHDWGKLERLTDSRVELPGGAAVAVDDDTYLDGTVVGATAIQCKAGSAEGRVAVTKDLKVIGILMVTPKHGRLPF